MTAPLDSRPSRASRRRKDLLLVLALSVLAWVVMVSFDVGERLRLFLLRAKPPLLDELLLALTVLAAGLLWLAWRQTMRARSEARSRAAYLAEAAALAADRQSLLDASPSVIYRCDLGAGPARPVFASQRIREVLGYEPEECLDPSWWPTVLHPADAARVENSFAALFEQGRLVHEYRALHKDGTYRWILDELALHHAADGTPSHFVGSWTDITDRTEMARQVEESEARFRLLFENAPDAIYVHDTEGRFVDGNPAAEELCGYAKEELIGRSFLAHPILPEYERQKAAAVLAASAGGRPSGPAAVRLHRADGSLVDVEIHARPFTVAGRNLVLGILRDVSERQRLLAELQLSRDNFQALVERSDLGMLVLSGERAVLYANHAAADLLGQPLEGLRGGVFEPVPAAGQRLDTPFESAGGEERTVEVRSGTTSWRNEEALLVGLRDVSAERAAERRARQAEVLGAFRRLSGHLAHELNNVLQGIMSGLELLVLEGEGTAADAVMVEALQERVGKGARLIRQLLLLTRPPAPGDETVTLGDLVQAAAPRLARLLPAGVDLRVNPNGPPVTVRGSSELLEQLLGHLVENAAEAMPCGGEVAIRWGTAGEAGPAFISVADRGSGVPEDIRARIFEPFVTGKDPLLHLGLGLAVASALAESHGGRLELDPAAQGGTTARLILPASAAAAAAENGAVTRGDAR